METFNVWYAKDKFAMMNFDAPAVAHKADYKMVAAVEANTLANLDFIFDTMNVYRDDGSDLPLKLGVRSMCVGDIVVVPSGDAYYCAGCGWTKVVFR